MACQVIEGQERMSLFVAVNHNFETRYIIPNDFDRLICRCVLNWHHHQRATSESA